jgi:hypothetical protein
MPLTTAAEIAEDVLDATGIKVSRTTVYKSLRIMNMSRKIATRSRQHQTRNMSHPFFHGTPFASDAMAFDELMGLRHDERPIAFRRPQS